MSQEVLEIVQNLNLSTHETQFILQCAPMIAGLKASNLLIVCHDNAEKIKELLDDTDISYTYLARTERKTTMLIYHERLLKNYLSQRKVQDLLFRLGYGKDMDLNSVTESVRKKYAAYILREGEFPHEMGLLLGYPVEDVKGYMDNLGRNSLYTGYWQVYKNPEAKQILFERYELAKENLIRLVSEGIEVTEIIGRQGRNLRRRMINYESRRTKLWQSFT